MDRDERRVVIGLAILGLLLIAMAAGPRVPQWPGYHNFAADHDYLGIPNFWNVLSNVPFLLIALAGFRNAGKARVEALVFHTGVLLTGFGSAYYHWAPTNSTLFWDRLPMTIAFGAFTAALIAQRISPAWGRKALWPLVIFGALSVVYWRWTESIGKGNLVPYGFVQFGSLMLALVIQVMFPIKGEPQKLLWWAFALYAIAKVLEMTDRHIGDALHIVGGHPFKHLAAAAACYCIHLALFRKAAD